MASCLGPRSEALRRKAQALPSEAETHPESKQQFGRCPRKARSRGSLVIHAADPDSKFDFGFCTPLQLLRCCLPGMHHQPDHTENQTQDKLRGKAPQTVGQQMTALLPCIRKPKGCGTILDLPCGCLETAVEPSGTLQSSVRGRTDVSHTSAAAPMATVAPRSGPNELSQAAAI